MGATPKQRISRKRRGDRRSQQHVDEASHRVRGEHSEHPQRNQDNQECGDHVDLPVMRRTGVTSSDSLAIRRSGWSGGRPGGPRTHETDTLSGCLPSAP